MTREQMAQQANDIHQEAAERTEAHFYAQRGFWLQLEATYPAKYRAAYIRVFQANRREITGLCQ